MPRALFLSALMALPGLAAAEPIAVPAGQGALAAALKASGAGAELVLAPGAHAGPVVLDRPLSLICEPGAVIDGGEKGSVVTVTAPDVSISNCTIRGSGSSHDEIDSGVQLTKAATRARVIGNRIEGNLYGVDIHGARDALVARNVIVGRKDPRMNRRGNGVYVWNAPGARVEDNDIRFGRDGIFTNSSRQNVFARNLFRDLRFAVHYMYTNDSEVLENVSIGNHLGYAIMFSDRIVVRGNLSLHDRDHGLMLNYANKSDITGNLVRGGAEKCAFIYNAHGNLIFGNRFEGCEIGIHFTAGSERNAVTGNAFVGNRTQVKYVGSRMVEWSLDGRGNYWSDNPAFDLDGDGIADGVYRPNDLMDHILWSQPAARLLLGSPAVQLLRWTQSSFPATLPGGVRDSRPLMAPVVIPVRPDVAAMEADYVARKEGS
ncbi:nitrous oxide reductase family maturation protein NosD [Oceanicella actignis]|uniref:nitrous oxide reductase family maturation protein NosD n=1 Tax=Oceanicella actignis TaxID=1189325 RepID=UPI0011E72749|nr:nitrous oxide reductase family maturation protein NosD [Oceanicella actignis]TYO84570.1 nitrous oxidase accessory protein [Oceanicella actignis]